MSNSDGTDRNGTLVEVHTTIGKDGCIVELRPEEHEFPHERDMEQISKEEARRLRDQLDQYLQEGSEQS